MVGHGFGIRLSRRSLLLSISCMLGSTGGFAPGAAARGRQFPLPDRRAFQPGDFVFPKEKGRYVPYSADGAKSYQEERDQWERERAEAIEELRDSTDEYSARFREALSRMTFEEFRSIYIDGKSKESDATDYSLGPVSVGHVGIIDIDDDGTQWVIEAMPKPKGNEPAYPKPGVDRVRYDDWIRYRRDQLVWHAQIKPWLEHEQRNVLPADRKRIVEEARKLLGKPYKFFRFRLDDTSGFYCSKLVWLAVFRAIDVPIDGNGDPERLFPVSPKQILYAKRVRRLHEPGPYWRT